MEEVLKNKVIFPFISRIRAQEKWSKTIWEWKLKLQACLKFLSYDTQVFILTLKLTDKATVS